MLTARNLQKRRDFYNIYKDWTLEQWRTVLWSDEAIFYCSGTSSNRVYRCPGSDPYDPKFTETTVKYPNKVMVWGCFSYHGVGDLVLLPPNTSVNTACYFTILMDHLHTSFDKCQAEVFQHDGAPAHTAKDIADWLADCGLQVLGNWPGNSPDLSPIENLWAIMKARLRSKDTSTLPKLQEELRCCWDELSQELLQNLADSMPKRLSELKKKKFRGIKY